MFITDETDKIEKGGADEDWTWYLEPKLRSINVILKVGLL
jgi:hypothetical protein